MLTNQHRHNCSDYFHYSIFDWFFVTFKAFICRTKSFFFCGGGGSFCSGKSGMTSINPDQKMSNHSENNCGLINPQQLNCNYAWCCSILWNMMSFEADHTSELLCQAPFAHLHLPIPLLQLPLSSRTRVSADIKHVLSSTTEPQEPNSKEMTAHSPAHTSVKFQLLRDLVAVCCQSACLGREWFAVEKHEGRVHPPGC